VQAAVTAAGIAVELSETRYRHGLASYLEVLTNRTIAHPDERATAVIATRWVVSGVPFIMALGGGGDAARPPRSENLPGWLGHPRNRWILSIRMIASAVGPVE
jgi:outer membrane protein TolC